jgi:error-prone DNA polymerase
MAELFRDFPRAVRETRAIAERCEFTLADLGYRFPEPPLDPGETADGTLRRRVFEGARRRWPHITPRIASQLEHELGIISRLGLAGYFLVVHDIVEFCRREGILAQGRGSAANSAVCYALGITAVDAVAMDLLFERFLSEERGEWPDIDIDLPSGERRERVIQYVYSRYGPYGAAMTADVITYRVRSAVRQVGRALGLDPQILDRLSRSLTAHGFVDDNDRIAPQIRRAGLDPSSARVRQFVQLVEAIQGLPRHLGQHSGGMVLSAGRLDEVVPLEPARMPGRVVIQWDKDDCADLGIIKVDLLGLGMMAVLEDAIPLVRAHEGIEIDLARLPPDDPEVYARLRQADTIGVFQVESRAQMATLPRLKPERFYDLVVEVAIIRPGPIVGDMVHPYLARRAGREPVTYDHPLLEPILRRTLGVPLFQEQLLRMAVAVAGFTPGEAEELRRAMGFKRSVERMRALEQRLREGMARNGIVGETARKILKSITSFALYGFPESHAASFALLAYASAYLKVHHGAAFTCALLDNWPMGFYHPATIVQDARRHGIPVFPVDVAHSAWRCTLERTAEGQLGVRLGLRYVRGLREASGRRIEAERPFRSLGDLARRCALGQDELERLAHAGALASFGFSRRDALWQVAAVERDPDSLLVAAEPASPETSPLPSLSPLEETLADYAATGLTTGEHVLRHLRATLAARGVLSSAELRRAPDGQRVKIAGLVIVRQRPATAKGFLFLTLEDEHGTANVVVTPQVFERERLLLHTAPILLVEGEVQSVDGVIHVRGRRFEALPLPGVAPPAHEFR